MGGIGSVDSRLGLVRFVCFFFFVQLAQSVLFSSFTLGCRWLHVCAFFLCFCVHAKILKKCSDSSSGAVGGGRWVGGWGGGARQIDGATGCIAEGARGLGRLSYEYTSTTSTIASAKNGTLSWPFFRSHEAGVPLRAEREAHRPQPPFTGVCLRVVHTWIYCYAV